MDSNEGCSPYCVVFRDESRVKTAEDLIYKWNFGDGRFSGNVNPTYCFVVEDGTDSETYATRLVVTTQDGCKDSTIVAEPITVHSNPVADFTMSDQSIDFLDPNTYVENTSIGGQFWDWDFGDGNTSIAMDPMEHEYLEPGTFTITLKTASRYGCKDEVSKKLLIERHQTYFIPKSFSPNGDGLNDFFFLKGEDLVEVKLWIYDRWGKQLFYGENENASWDGRVDNEMSPIGAYGFVVTYQHTGKVRKTEHGTLFITKTNSKNQ